MSYHKKEAKNPQKFCLTFPKKFLLPDLPLKPNWRISADLFFSEPNYYSVLFKIRENASSFYDEYFKKMGFPLKEDFLDSENLTKLAFENIISSIVIDQKLCCDPRVSAYFPEDHPIQTSLLTNLKNREKELDELLATFYEYAACIIPQDMMKKTEIPNIFSLPNTDDSSDISTLETNIIEKSKALYALHRALVDQINTKIATLRILKTVITSVISILKEDIASQSAQITDAKSAGQESSAKTKLDNMNKWLDLGLGNLDEIGQNLSTFTLFPVPLTPSSDASLNENIQLINRANCFSVLPCTILEERPISYRSTIPAIGIATQKILDAQKKMDETVQAGLTGFGARLLSILGSSATEQPLLTDKETREQKRGSSQALTTKASSSWFMTILGGKKELPPEALIAEMLKSDPNPVYELLFWGMDKKELHGKPRTEYFTDEIIIDIVKELLKDKEIVRKCFVEPSVLKIDHFNVISALTIFHGSRERRQIYPIKDETRLKIAQMIRDAAVKKEIPITSEDYESLRANRSLRDVEEVDLAITTLAGQIQATKKKPPSDSKTTPVVDKSKTGAGEVAADTTFTVGKDAMKAFNQHAVVGSNSSGNTTITPTTGPVKEKADLKEKTDPSSKKTS